MPSRRARSPLAGLDRVRRAGWNITDQGLSALTNVVLAFVVARSVDAQGFGAFSVAFLCFSLVIGIEQSLIGQPLAMRHSHETPAQQRLTAARALGTAFALGLLGSALAVVGGLVADDALGRVLLALAAVLPFLIVQDAARMAFFAWARPRDAAVNDLVWTVVQFTLIAAVVTAGAATPATMVLCWGLGALVAVLVALRQLRVLPTLRGVRGWVRQHGDLVGYLMLEYLVGIGAFQGGLLLIGASLGVGDIGALRAAQVLLGPVGILATAAQTFGVPEVARRTSLPARTERLALAGSGALVVVTGVYVTLLLLLPDAWGVALLGDTWSGASTVLLPVAMASLVAGGKLGPAIVLYGLGLANRTIWLVSSLGVLAVVLMAVGSAAAGAVGLAWGLAAAQAAIVPWWFLLLRRALREGTRPAGANADTSTGAVVAATDSQPPDPGDRHGP